MSPKRKHYVRLFSNLYNVDLAIRLLNEGYTYKYIGDKLHCDRTSVMSFQERKSREGVVFKKFRLRRGKDQANVVEAPPPPPVIIKNLECEIMEKINPGKDTYQDYLAQYKLEICDTQRERMARAREVIRELRAKKKEEGIVEDPYLGAWV